MCAMAARPRLLKSKEKIGPLCLRFMGRPASLAGFLAWHVVGLLSGIACKGLWQSPVAQLDVWQEVIERTARAASDRCAEKVTDQCCDSAQSPSKKGDNKKQSRGSKSETGSSDSGIWIVLIVTACNWGITSIGGCIWWACCRRRRCPETEEQREEASPRSPVERQELARQQLLEVRLRRHGAR